MISNRKGRSNLAVTGPVTLGARRFTSRSVKIFCLVVALLPAMLTSPATATRILQNYDLDSLTELGRVIVKVRLGASVTDTPLYGDGRVNAAKILQVVKVSEKEADTIFSSATTLANSPTATGSDFS